MTNENYDDLDFELDELAKGNSEPLREALQNLSKEELVEAVIELNELILGVGEQNEELH